MIYRTKTDARDPWVCPLLSQIRDIGQFNNDLSCLKTYFDDNRLSPNPQILINSEPLRQVSVAKYLGMYVDENLFWDHHNDTFVKINSSQIRILRSLRNIVL